MPPLALIQAAQAGATVAPWSLEEACAPVSEPITPTLISAPFGAEADVPLVVAPDDPDDEELLPLLHAATPSAAAKTPASSAVRVNADRLVSRAIRCVLLIIGPFPLPGGHDLPRHCGVSPAGAVVWPSFIPTTK
jgi:hypothetical protein